VSELCFQSAVNLQRMVRDGEISCLELLEAHLAQQQRTNGVVNAIVTHTDAAARAAAVAADEAIAAGEPLGPLHGLPIAHKDLVMTSGIRTTYGSPIFADFVPDQNELIIQRLIDAGAITIGKTNVPEFGAGSQTFNPVFGATLNPYDTSRTCGGSSGGAAVALACGMVPIADGSDMGGSLRNPANFNNVVGFRTSPGRVPMWPSETPWFPLGVQGPMARTVEDVALMLTVLAGPDARVPLSIEQPGSLFAGSLERDFKGVRIGFSPDLDGQIPLAADVRSVLDSSGSLFEDLGCELDQAAPSFRDADNIFKTLRAWRFAMKYAPLMGQHRDKLKDTVRWNADQGLKLTGSQLAEASRQRSSLLDRVAEFMEDHEFLLLAVSQVAPFDVEQPYVTEVDGVAMETYIDWMQSCYFITVTGLPAISVPAGFTEDGLPVGIQIVGRQHDELGVLQLAYAFQQATEVWRQAPALAVAAE
jgi:amidase